MPSQDGCLINYHAKRHHVRFTPSNPFVFLRNLSLSQPPIPTPSVSSLKNYHGGLDECFEYLQITHVCQAGFHRFVIEKFGRLYWVFRSFRSYVAYVACVANAYAGFVANAYVAYVAQALQCTLGHPTYLCQSPQRPLDTPHTVRYETIVRYEPRLTLPARLDDSDLAERNDP